MCGRFVRDCSLADIAEEFGLGDLSINPAPRYNIAPGEAVPVIKKNGKKNLVSCTWGFIPSWAKDPKSGCRMINARAETASQKPAFRSAYNNARALIPATGFFEWKKEGKEKYPFYIRLKSGSPFSFAGLYSIWISPGGEQVCTCAILTTVANQLLAPVHDRMPVIIRKEDRDRWLDPHARESDLQALLIPYESNEMECYSVSRIVNTPAHDSPECIKRESGEA